MILNKLKIGGPKLFVCTFSRRSDGGGPPRLKRRVNGVQEIITQHELLWEMLLRKNGTFSGLELFNAITTRLPPIQRSSNLLNFSHVQGFLYQAEQEWIKRMDLRQTAMNSGRGGIDQDAKPVKQLNCLTGFKRLDSSKSYFS